MPFFKRSLAGPGYIILNILRAANIVALLAVVVASCVMLVKTFVVSKFFFFDAISHIITATLGRKYCISSLLLFYKLTSSDSDSDRIRAVALPQLLLAQLATSQRVLRLRHPRYSHDRRRCLDPW